MSGAGLPACEHASCSLLSHPACPCLLGLLTRSSDRSIWLAAPFPWKQKCFLWNMVVCAHVCTPPAPPSQLTFKMLVGGSGLQCKTFVSWILVLFYVVVMLKMICMVVKTLAGRSLVPGWPLFQFLPVVLASVLTVPLAAMINYLVTHNGWGS